ncbi:hypothetical protein, partial [Picosynechococcus sp. PCC 7002]|uniref:hypothetical protein n=1 Tax=Picosynechococcus sp. (strain ATCC 27264 / PCC 7002 / PR-6) TaxID=32049 RepID=UPI001C3D09D0
RRFDFILFLLLIFFLALQHAITRAMLHSTRTQEILTHDGSLTRVAFDCLNGQDAFFTTR